MKKNITGDLFGGLAAMLVALPSAIAFGLIIFSPLGAQYASLGAIAGILGSVALGLVSPLLGGTQKLITAPCAPAAAILAALAVELVNNGTAIEQIPAILVVVGLLAAIIQFSFGALGGGRLIKYIPYPVVAGYLSGVGILIISGQVGKFLGIPKSFFNWSSLINPTQWNLPAISIGMASILLMVLAPKLIKKIPAAIIALCGGIAVYFLLSLGYPELTTLENNPLVVGNIGSTDLLSLINATTERFHSLAALSFSSIWKFFTPALMLATLLSIDTLKTCVVVDALTRSRHNSNKELRAQGLGNLTSALIGGMPGAGTMGATLVNLNSGGQSRLSGVFTGIFSLLTLLLVGGLVAWVPFAALAGILIFIGFRMIDWKSIKLLKQRSTIIDFLVVAAVVFTALTFNLMAASGVGVALAILLFLREQIRASVIRRSHLGNQMFSKRRRLADEMAILEKEGEQTAIFELQGSLFFGTTDQLLTELEPHLRQRRFIILDMKRVRTIDFTAAHLLEQIENQIIEHKGHLLISSLTANLATGADLKSYLLHLGLMKHQEHVHLFSNLDEAIEWTEEVLLKENNMTLDENKILDLEHIDVFSELNSSARQTLAHYLESKSIHAGGTVFKQGDNGSELYIIRRGIVKIVLPLKEGKNIHLTTFSQGDFFGDMSFLDKGTRSADAIATTSSELFVLDRDRFHEAIQKHPELGSMIYSQIAQTLALRLRLTDTELRALEES